jgi:hypothetical protein
MECEGELLRIELYRYSESQELFREKWTKGNPVVVANIHQNLIRNLWTPQSSITPQSSTYVSILGEVFQKAKG